MDKEIMEYIHNSIYYATIERWNLVVCFNLNATLIYDTEREKSGGKNDGKPYVFDYKTEIIKQWGEKIGVGGARGGLEIT